MSFSSRYLAHSTPGSVKIPMCARSSPSPLSKRAMRLLELALGLVKNCAEVRLGPWRLSGRPPLGARARAAAAAGGGEGRDGAGVGGARGGAGDHPLGVPRGREGERARRRNRGEGSGRRSLAGYLRARAPAAASRPLPAGPDPATPPPAVVWGLVRPATLREGGVRGRERPGFHLREASASRTEPVPALAPPPFPQLAAGWPGPGNPAAAAGTGLTTTAAGRRRCSGGCWRAARRGGWGAW